MLIPKAIGITPSTLVIAVAPDNPKGIAGLFRQAVDALVATHRLDWRSTLADWVGECSALLEPLIMAILGVLVGGLVIAMYLPIFKLGAVV